MPRADILKSTRRGLGIRAGVFNKSGLLGVDSGGSARTLQAHAGAHNLPNLPLCPLTELLDGRYYH